MKKHIANIENVEVSKVSFFKTVLEDKMAMRDYIKKNGSLKGYKSDHFEFAKPL